MVSFSDEKVDRWIKVFKKKVRQKYRPEKIILFGSRARNEHLLQSDLDLVIVSQKFKGIKWPRRLSEVADLWPGLIAIEPLCYTPEEFEAKKKQLGIVRQAVKEGIEL